MSKIKSHESIKSNSIIHIMICFFVTMYISFIMMSLGDISTITQNIDQFKGKLNQKEDDYQDMSINSSYLSMHDQRFSSDSLNLEISQNYTTDLNSLDIPCISENMHDRQLYIVNSNFNEYKIQNLDLSNSIQCNDQIIDIEEDLQQNMFADNKYNITTGFYEMKSDYGHLNEFNEFIDELDRLNDLNEVKQDPVTEERSIAVLNNNIPTIENDIQMTTPSNYIIQNKNIADPSIVCNSYISMQRRKMSNNHDLSFNTDTKDKNRPSHDFIQEDSKNLPHQPFHYDFTNENIDQTIEGVIDTFFERGKESNKSQSRKAEISNGTQILKRTKKIKTSNRSFICNFPECYRAFTRLQHLKNHFMIHTKEKPFKCEITGCNKKFTSSHVLKRHSRIHTKEKLFKCDFIGCKKMSTLAQHLQNHDKIYSKEKPFICRVPGCNKAYTRSKNLKVHTMIHTGEKPYKYKFQECQRAFTSSQNLKMHNMIHMEEKSFKCNVIKCHKAYTKLANLKAHNMIHTGEKPFECNFPKCHKWFTRLQGLKTHNMIHTGEKPFKCKFLGCQKAYTRSQALKRHNISHMKENFFKCKFSGCHKTYKRSHNLNRHLRMHNANDVVDES